MKDIPGYEKRYAVTDDGRVWSYEKRSRVGKNGGIRIDGNDWLKLHEAKSSSGKIYHRVVLIDKSGKRKQWLVHRLVGICYIPNPNNMPFINHISGNTTDNRVENLEWCDAKGNAAHAHKNGWIKLPNQKGVLNSQAKVTQEDVELIRTMARQGCRGTHISKELGVCRSTVNDIINYRTWKEQP